MQSIYDILIKALVADSQFINEVAAHVLVKAPVKAKKVEHPKRIHMETGLLIDNCNYIFDCDRVVAKLVGSDVVPLDAEDVAALQGMEIQVRLDQNGSPLEKEKLDMYIARLKRFSECSIEP